MADFLSFRLSSSAVLVLLAGPTATLGHAATPAKSAVGAVFAMTNRAKDPGNEVVMYARAPNGALTMMGSISTGGRGIGTDLDAQGPLRLSRDHNYLYAVNAGTDSVSVFSVSGSALTLLQQIDTADEPIALAIHGSLLYVLSGSVAGNGIIGYSIGSNGTLTELPNSFRNLSSPIAVPGDIEFSPDGHFVLVTHKSTDLTVPPYSIIDSFSIDVNGYASEEPVLIQSVGLRPFSLRFRADGVIFVGESHNGHPGLAAASTYRFDNGNADVISASVSNFQTDTCWEILSPDGKYAYTSNFGTGNISSYRLYNNGAAELLQGQAAFFGADSQPVDSAMSSDGKFFYQLLRGPGGVAALRVNPDGSLKLLGETDGILPVNDGASGLAAY